MTKTVKHNITRSYVTPVRTRDREVLDSTDDFDPTVDFDQARRERMAADLSPYGLRRRTTFPFHVEVKK